MTRAKLIVALMFLSSSAMSQMIRRGGVGGQDITPNTVTAASSVTASAFFGDGSHLAGIPSTASLTGTYVPYTGATANVVLGNNNLSANYGITAATGNFSGQLIAGSVGNVINYSNALNSAVTFSNVLPNGYSFRDGSTHDLDLTATGSATFPYGVSAGSFTATAAITGTGANGNVISASSITTTGGMFAATLAVALGNNAFSTWTVVNAVGNGLYSNAAGNLDPAINNTIGPPRLAAVQNVSSTGDNIWGIAVGANASPATIVLAKTRSSATDANTIVANADGVGSIDFDGADGAARYRTAARIKVSVDAAPGSANMPGNMQFLTTPSGSASPTERMRITNAGNVGVGTASPGSLVDIASGTLTVEGTGSLINFTGGDVGISRSAAGVLNIGNGSAASTAAALKVNDGYFDTINTISGGTVLEIGYYSPGDVQICASAACATRTTFKNSSGFVGIGALTPAALLHMSSGTLLRDGNGVAPTGFYIKTSSADASTTFGVQGNGVIVSSTVIPTISCNAGTGVMSSDSTNNWGSFTAGAAAANCTVTFSLSGWANNARCVVTDDTSLVSIRVSAQSKTAFTVAGTTISGDVIQYICAGN